MCEPCESSEIFVRGTRIKLFVSGPDAVGERESWSFARIKNQSDIEKNPDFVTNLCRIYKEAGVFRIDAPPFGVTSMDILESSQLIPLQLDGVFVLGRNQWRGAGGFFLNNEGDMLGTSQAGCAFVIMTGGGYALVLHASRDNLIAREVLFGQLPMRGYVSIIDAAVKKFDELRVPRNELSASILFAMPTNAYIRQFNHKIFGEYNRKFYGFVKDRWPYGVKKQNGNGTFFIDLEGLCVSQLYDNEVRNISIGYSLKDHPELTYSYDCRRNPVDHNGCELPRRNFIGIQRFS